MISTCVPFASGTKGGIPWPLTSTSAARQATALTVDNIVGPQHLHDRSSESRSTRCVQMDERRDHPLPRRRVGRTTLKDLIVQRDDIGLKAVVDYVPDHLRVRCAGNVVAAAV